MKDIVTSKYINIMAPRWIAGIAFHNWKLWLFVVIPVMTPFGHTHERWIAFNDPNLDLNLKK